MKSIFSIVFIFLIFCLKSRGQDLSLTMNDLEFKTDQEKIAYENFRKSENLTSAITLLLSSYESHTITTEQAENKINEKVKYIKENILQYKSDQKRINFLSDYIHREFLSSYKLENNFFEIFKDGKYNCVSASALYALIFSKCGIPYIIKEQPTHVFLVAYPGTSNIVVETTLPEFGYYQFSIVFMQKYVDKLISSKLISQREIDTSSVEKIFKRYFYERSSIDLKKLVALQYNNYGIYLMEKKRYKEATEWLKKFYLLYPEERSSFVLRNALGNAIDNTSDTKELLNLYALMLKYKTKANDEFTNEEIKSVFAKISEEQLISQSDVTGFKNAYNGFIRDIKDTSLASELAFVYYYQLARYSILSGKKDSTDAYLEKAYFFKPENVQLQGVISSVILERVALSEEIWYVYKLVNSYREKYSFLNDNESFNNVLSICYLEIAFQNFRERNPVRGEEFLKKFETLVAEKNVKEPNERSITRAYSEAAAHYYRVGNKAKASEKIRIGLRYYPQNFTLKEMQRQMN